MIANDTSTRIAAVNDEFRHSMKDCIVTKGVGELTLILADIFDEVRQYKDFTEDNDPYGEHDFGSFEFLGIKLFWKIDYYDKELKCWHDPLDPGCHRVLTIMKAEEY